MEDLTNTELFLNQSHFKITNESVQVKDLVLLQPLKDAREDTYAGLYTSIKEMGVLNPIVVTPTVAYLEYLEKDDEDKEEFTDPRYKVLDGFRRLYAGMRLGLETLPARVITFETPNLGTDFSLLFGLVLNRYQAKSLKENWGLLEALELDGNFDVATLDWLLMLEPGDVLRLKDVMSSDYPELIEQLLDGKKNLTQAYNTLQKLRKEENQTELDDQRSLSGVAEEVIDNVEEEQKLSANEVKELLDMAKSDTDLDDEDFGGDGDQMFGEDAEDYVQDTKNRERLSPELRSAILRRDDFKCQICGFGEGISSSIQLGLLECHHITAVYTGGTDSSENFITACSRCHSFIHILAGFNAKIGMKKEEFEEIPQKDKDMITNAVKYARILLKAEEKSGKKLKKYKPVRIPFWTAQAEAQQVLAELSKGGSDENS